MVDLAAETGLVVFMRHFGLCAFIRRHQYWIAAMCWGFITVWRIIH